MLRPRSLLCVCASLCAAVICPSRALAGQVTTGAAGITFISGGFPDNNYGGSTFIVVGTNGQGGVMRGLVRFDMPSPALQGRVTVTSATLTMTIVSVGFNALGTGGTYVLDGVDVDSAGALWAQGTGVAGNGESNMKANQPGGWMVGQPCTPGGVTWSTSDCSSSWTPGAPVFSTGTGSTTTTSAGGTVTWASTAGMVADVQHWIDSGHWTGWRIRRNDEGAASHSQGFSKTATLSFAYTPCTVLAKSDCQTGAGNVCVDPNPTGTVDTTYTCVCNGNYRLGTAPDGNPGCILVADAGSSDASTDAASDAATTDSGATDASTTDSGPVTDSGMADDSGTSADSGHAPDAGMATDSGVAGDAGTQADSGGAADAGGSDSGTLADAGSPSDSGSPQVDAGAADDAGIVEGGSMDDAGDVDATVDGSAAAPSGGSGGCGCEMARATSLASSGLPAAGMLVLFLGRRRRRKRNHCSGPGRRRGRGA